MGVFSFFLFSDVIVLEPTLDYNSKLQHKLVFFLSFFGFYCASESKSQFI